jgi:nucleoside-diphosphate-sugar epimerase
MLLLASSAAAAAAVAVFPQVELLEGDLNSDDLGLSQRELSLVQNNVNILIHSAASIQLEADVQHTLRSNYLGTRRLLALATQMQQLRAMVHVSTAYVNVNFPRGSTVDERIFPLYFGEQEVHHADIVDDLMSLKPAAANVRVSAALWGIWGFGVWCAVRWTHLSGSVVCVHSKGGSQEQ